MTDMKKPKVERLYLDKEGQAEVFIDSCPLAQHQIEGIRILFRQFTKKKPGVILSNPEGYGKSIQVALFLDAVRNLLTNPVLILCEDDNRVNSWKQTLIKWTKYTEEDIVVDSSNLYIKMKTIFLKKSMHLVTPYTRRDWGVVVVKNDFALKQLLKTPIKATFKIWLTTIDMRKDLQMFNTIYCWLYSEKKFDINKYIDSISKNVDSLTSLVRLKLLYAFLDDVVIIKNDFTPPKKPEVIQEEFESKVSRKNKDATGTKIKRSKKTIESDSLIANNTVLDNFYNTDHTYVESNANSNSITTVTGSYKQDRCDVNDNMDYKPLNDEGLDVESFIAQKEPVQCGEYEFLNESNSTDTEDMSFTEALNDIVETENDENDVPEKNSETVVSNFTDDEVITLSSDTDDEISSNVNSRVKNAEVSHKKTKNISLSKPVERSVCTNGIGKNKRVKCIDSKMADVLTGKTDRNKGNRRDIVQDISVMEERAMKKFKGSLLDSFFKT